MKGKIIIKKDWCKGCGYCIEECPNGCIRLSKNINIIGYHNAEFNEENNCKGCALCAQICPDVCIEIYKVDD